MTTACYINNTNQTQHKLRNSKKLARKRALSAPKYRAYLQLVHTPHAQTDIQATRLKWYDIAMRLMQTSSLT